LLIGYGITPRKTFTLNFPTIIPDEYIKDYIRGYIDGDGSLYFLNDKRYKKPLFYLNMVGNEQFIKRIKELIKEKLGIDGKFRKNTSIYILEYIKKDSIRKLCEWLYQPGCISLERKWSKWLLVKGDE